MLKGDFIHLEWNLHLLIGDRSSYGGRMFKKIFWFTILILMVACTIYLARGLNVEIHAAPAAGDAKDSISTPLAFNADASGTLTNTQAPTQLVITAAPETPVPPAATEKPTSAFLIIPREQAAAAAVSSPTPFFAQYKFQVFNPVYLDNFAHQQAGCNWTGVAGQVFDEYGDTVNNIVVKVTGTWNGSPVSLIGITGMVDGQPYGPGSYEIMIGNKPMDTVSELMIQLFDTNAHPLTSPTVFDTSANCKRNLVIINFSKK